jgi:hypothetical protein
MPTITFHKSSFELLVDYDETKPDAPGLRLWSVGLVGKRAAFTIVDRVRRDVVIAVDAMRDPVRAEIRLVLPNRPLYWTKPRVLMNWAARTKATKAEIETATGLRYDAAADAVLTHPLGLRFLQEAHR